MEAIAVMSCETGIAPIDLLRTAEEAPSVLDAMFDYLSKRGREQAQERSQDRLRQQLERWRG